MLWVLNPLNAVLQLALIRSISLLSLLDMTNCYRIAIGDICSLAHSCRISDSNFTLPVWHAGKEGKSEKTKGNDYKATSFQRVSDLLTFRLLYRGNFSSYISNSKTFKSVSVSVIKSIPPKSGENGRKMDCGLTRQMDGKMAEKWKNGQKTFF